MKEKFVKAVGKGGQRGFDFPGVHVENAVEAPKGIGRPPR